MVRQSRRAARRAAATAQQRHWFSFCGIGCSPLWHHWLFSAVASALRADRRRWKGEATGMGEAEPQSRSQSGCHSTAAALVFFLRYRVFFPVASLGVLPCGIGSTSRSASRERRGCGDG